MSGLVSMRFARRRSAGAVLARRVAVVDRRLARACTPNACSDRAWSCASALAGYRYSARARASRESTSSVGSWKHSDLPDAVPVVTIVGPLPRGLERLGLVAPEEVDAARAQRRRARRGAASCGQRDHARGSRACCDAWRTSRSSARPASSSASHGSMSRTRATPSIARRCACGCRSRGRTPNHRRRIAAARKLALAASTAALDLARLLPRPPTPPTSATRPRTRAAAATRSAATPSTRTRPRFLRGAQMRVGNGNGKGLVNARRAPRRCARAAAGDGGDGGGGDDRRRRRLSSDGGFNPPMPASLRCVFYDPEAVDAGSRLSERAFEAVRAEADVFALAATTRRSRRGDSRRYRDARSRSSCARWSTASRRGVGAALARAARRVGDPPS